MEPLFWTEKQKIQTKKITHAVMIPSVSKNITDLLHELSQVTYGLIFNLP